MNSERIPMTLNDYQNQAATTAIYPNRNQFGGLIYTALKLNGEAGEVAEKVGKIIRDKNSELDQDQIELLAKECGDVLWYVAMLADELGYTLEEIAQLNLAKLFDRKKRGKLQGSGDTR